MSSAARFIVLEGGEGCGKSTQAKLLADAIGARLTREPGGTKLAEKIRNLLLHDRDHELTPRAELLLLAAARAQHVDERILPTLRDGTHVVCDRFSGSTLAYQGYGRGLSFEDIIVADEIATQGLVPDLTILLEVPVDVAAKRRDTFEDRIESAGDDFHVRVAEGFHAIAAADPDHWVVVDGTQSIDAVAFAIRLAVTDRLGIIVDLS